MRLRIDRNENIPYYRSRKTKDTNRRKYAKNMAKILVNIPVTEEHKKMLEEAAAGIPIEYTKPKLVNEEITKDATIIIGNVSHQYVKAATDLKWVQLNSAGNYGYTKPGVLRPGTLLTNATGAYGLAISEHMIGMLLMLIKNLNKYYDNQKQHVWHNEGRVSSIYGTKTLVVGLGDIGGDFARKMYALGSEVTGIRRHNTAKPDYLAGQYQLDALDELLPQMDIVALTLPAYGATEGLFTKERLQKMKPGAILINVGRGTLVDNLALAELLREGTLGGALIDVTDPEPLPEDHPLWDAPNALITPHVSGGFQLPETLTRIVKIACENLIRFRKGETLRNLVDFETGYKKFEG